jgi:hypothetical protein
MKEDETDRACSTYGVTEIFIIKSENLNVPLGKHRGRW